jgi:asparagine synthase (glutamine-hydrolysing)
MCSINGIILKDDDDDPSSCKINILDQLIDGMKILKHRGPDGSGLMFDDEVIYFKDFNDVNITNGKSNRLGMGHNRLAIVGHASQPISNEDESIWTICNGEIYNYYELMEELNNHDFNTDTDSEIILHTYEEDMLDELDGDYAYCIYDKNKNIMILRRDTFGIKPLFYIDRDKYFAFASEKKALWSLLMKIDGMSFEEAYTYPVSRLNPNSQLTYDLNENEYEIGENLQKIRTDYFENNYNTTLGYETCKKELEEALWDSISKRTRGIDKIGIIYSGGVDSTLIAKMASEYSEVILYTVGTEESEDIKYAERAAKDMGLKFRKKIISSGEYEKYLLNVAYAIDEIDLMKLAVGIPIYVASELAREDGIKVVLSGQGADELFGGYNRYQKILIEKGKEELKKSLYNDVMNIYKVNLERDDHCTMANGVELRVPFLDKDVVEVGLSLPIEYKLDNERFRKKILRDIASNYIPGYIAYRPKKAAQYGSGSEKMIYAVARNHGYSKKKINEFFENVLIKKIKKIKTINFNIGNNTY